MWKISRIKKVIVGKKLKKEINLVTQANGYMDFATTIEIKEEYIKPLLILFKRAEVDAKAYKVKEVHTSQQITLGDDNLALMNEESESVERYEFWANCSRTCINQLISAIDEVNNAEDIL